MRKNYWQPDIPPNSRDPEILADAMERRLEGWGHVSFVELADWLGEPFRGNCRVTDARDPNIVFWLNLCPEIVKALNILIRTGRVEVRPTSPIIYAFDGGCLTLPVVKRPPSGGYAHAHWMPVVLVVPPGSAHVNDH